MLHITFIYRWQTRHYAMYTSPPSPNQNTGEDFEAALLGELPWQFTILQVRISPPASWSARNHKCSHNRILGGFLYDWPCRMTVIILPWCTQGYTVNRIIDISLHEKSTKRAAGLRRSIGTIKQPDYRIVHWIFHPSELLVSLWLLLLLLLLLSESIIRCL